MTRYFLTPDGEAGVKLDAPTEGEDFERLMSDLRTVYPDLQEVEEAEYREAERESEGEAWSGDPPV